MVGQRPPRSRACIRPLISSILGGPAVSFNFDLSVTGLEWSLFIANVISSNEKRGMTGPSRRSVGKRRKFECPRHLRGNGKGTCHLTILVEQRGSWKTHGILENNHHEIQMGIDTMGSCPIGSCQVTSKGEERAGSLASACRSWTSDSVPVMNAADYQFGKSMIITRACHFKRIKLMAGKSRNF